LHWRFPPTNAFAVSPVGEHENSLRLNPSKANVTSSSPVNTIEEMALVMRVQTDTLFSFSVDVVEFEPVEVEEEVGVTAFLTQTQHLDLGIVLLPTDISDSDSDSDSSNEDPGSSGKGLGKSDLALHLRFRVTNIPLLVGNFDGVVETVVQPLPSKWVGKPITLMIDAVNETFYALSAASSSNPDEVVVVGMAPGTILSGGDGDFSGTMLGVYATTNGGNGTTESYISKWRYTGKGQDINNNPELNDPTFVAFSPLVGSH